MRELKKKNIIILIMITIITLTIGCTLKVMHDRNVENEKATIAAIEHIKKKENIDVIVTKVDIRPAVSGGMIRVSGHVKDQKNRKFFVSISKRQNYSIVGWGLDRLE
ncbi:hypothetical protein P4U05_16690 [Bacillus paranthracis]|uniref:hypothetical protein n=1 Tax=Bacillus TaxID=1386 RepID=UPI000200F5E4|nr:MULTISPECIES: hypothetical protein [Bacillus]ADY20412.1 hypothetical protein YBT020_05830 [Bacillus thuringiensis serovar finitimus YBT-020]MRC72894.1 hypothetical protein [Bacillus thuringiensis]OTX71352.1 hypothetical protein BK722_13155 [Bacillus thuringiensis serovar finitimus]MCR6799316.1 hypothetical protein [Bacillus paranthracis]MEC3358525.1 hypothetical protein [Bacillus paranthracis]